MGLRPTQDHETGGTGFPACAWTPEGGCPTLSDQKRLYERGYLFYNNIGHMISLGGFIHGNGSNSNGERLMLRRFEARHAILPWGRNILKKVNL